MIDLRKRIFILVGIVAGIIAAVLLVIFVLYRNQETPPLDNGDVAQEDGVGIPSTPGTIGTTTEQPSVPTAGQAPIVPDEDAEERFVRHLARTFVERFGSYSNQNGNQHIEEALLLSTERMQRWITTQAIEQSGSYIGATTQVISSEVTSFSQNSAEVTVGVQEVVRFANGTEERNYNNGRVELVSDGAEWKVDALYWES